MFESYHSLVDMVDYFLGVTLVSDIAAHVPDALVGDESRLRQIAVKLVGNAIKFTEVGQVVVRASVKESHGKKIHLLLAVEDTGIGIPAAKHETVFDAFSQADGSTTRRYGGTGLGLAISRRLANAMGGQIWLNSREGEGSTFFFELPFEVQETQPQAASNEQFEDSQSSGKPATIDKQQPVLQTLLDDDTAGQDGFSLRAMLEQVEDDKEFLGELAVSILHNYPPYLDQVRAAVQSGDSDALQRNAHALKSIVGAAGINPAFSAALQLEQVGRDAQLNRAAETLVHLEEKIDQLKSVLHPLLPANTD
jgi:HPt (histidine-containing phosphotransfer) domain-containing protein